MSPSQTVSSVIAALATIAPEQTSGSDPSAGDVGSSTGSGDSDAGASGKSSGALTLSKGVIAAIIIVVVVVVALVGMVYPRPGYLSTKYSLVASAVLFYLAKKRNWQMKEAMRRSARRVVRALTPKRMTFGAEADALRSPGTKKSRQDKKGMAKMKEGDDVQMLAGNGSRKDLEKGISKVSSFSVEEEERESGWARKVGR